MEIMTISDIDKKCETMTISDIDKKREKKIGAYGWLSTKYY